MTQLHAAGTDRRDEPGCCGLPARDGIAPTCNGPRTCTTRGRNSLFVTFLRILTDLATVRAILAQLGKPTAPPRIGQSAGAAASGPARCQGGGLRARTQSAPQYGFDQRIVW